MKKFLIYLLLLSPLSYLLSPNLLAWTGPTVSPPGGDVAPPLDTTLSPQTKQGSLHISADPSNTVSAWLDYGLTVIGAPDYVTDKAADANLKLDVAGDVLASRICLGSTNNCYSTLGGSVYGGGAGTTGTPNQLLKWAGSGLSALDSNLFDNGTSIGIGAGTGAYLTGLPYQPLLFAGSSGHGIFIDTAGNVGVGTGQSSFVYPFQVNGSAYIAGNATTSGNLEIRGTASTSKLCIGSDCRTAWPYTSMTVDGKTIVVSSSVTVPPFALTFGPCSAVGQIWQWNGSAWNCATPPIGPQGPAGVNGATWYSGSGTPASTLGVNGDYYLNTATGDIYKKVSGAWGTPIENIKGATGATGATGPQGPAGVVSATAPLVLSSSNLSLSTSGCASGQVLAYNGSSWGCQAPGNSVTISGSSNYLSKIIGSAALGQSLLYDNGANVGVGNTSPATKVDISGGDLQVEDGEGRFKGWDSTGTGLGLEVGISAGNGYVFPYNRTSSTYAPLELRGSSISLVPQGGGQVYLGATAINDSYGNTNALFTGQNIMLFGNLNSWATTDYFKGQVTIDASSGSLCLGGVCKGSWPSGGAGTVTSISTGTGLTGGPITTSGTISLLSGYQLPQACAVNQIPKWNGSAWACAADATGSSGGVTSIFGRTGAVTAATGDYSVGQITGAAPATSPIFTGNVQITNGTLSVANGAPSPTSPAFWAFGDAVFSNYFVNGVEVGSGNITAWGKITMQSQTTASDPSNIVATKGYVDNATGVIVGGGTLSFSYVNGNAYPSIFSDNPDGLVANAYCTYGWGNACATGATLSAGSIRANSCSLGSYHTTGALQYGSSPSPSYYVVYDCVR